MQYLVKFTKEGDMKWISYLDLLRTIQRIIRRADFDIKYSEGFNPHMSISIAQPLSVGVESVGDYMDVELNSEITEQEFKRLFNENSQIGIKVVDVLKVKEIANAKKKSSMAMLDGASYEVAMKICEKQNIIKEIEEMLSMEKWEILKKGKSGDKIVDIKPLIVNFKYEVKEELILNLQLNAGSRSNLSCDLLVSFIKEKVPSLSKDSFPRIKRTEMYISKGKKLLPMIKAYN